MKKILFTGLALMFSYFGFAQHAGLTIINNSTTCSITVTVFATCPSFSGPYCYSYQTYPLTVAANTTLTYATLDDYMTDLGDFFNPPAHLPSINVLTDFQWTSAKYVSSCGISCTPTTALFKRISDCYACFGANLTNTNGCVSASWYTPYCVSVLDDVVLEFN